MRYLALLLLLMTSAALLRSQSDQSISFPTQSDHLINTWLEAHNIPALGIGIIDNYQITQIKVYGHLTTDKPAPYNAIFKVASLTKPVVSMVALTLINEGQLNIEDRLYEYWIDPDISDNPYTELLTIKHALTHQMGFKNWRRFNKDAKLDFDFSPGSKFQYSGEGYEYLREYLERRFDTTIETLADSLIFQPLGMVDTKFSWVDYVDTSRYAMNHDQSGAVIPTVRNLEASGADHLISTIEDYTKFALYVLKGGLLSKELYDQMITPQVEVNEHSSFGLGWEIVPDFINGHEVIMHSGSDPGVRSLVVLSPRTGEGIVVFSNSDNGGWAYWNDIIMSSFK